LVDKWPPLTPEQVSSIRSLLFDIKTPPQAMMRWRVRLYCGHQVERSAHRTHNTVSAALSTGSCPVCHLDPATIVAAEPLGLVSEPAEAEVDAARLEAELVKVNRRAAAVERQHRELTGQAAQLRQQLDRAQLGGNDTEQAPFRAAAGRNVLHRRDCRVLQPVGHSSNQAELSLTTLEFQTEQARIWLKRSTLRRCCKICAPEIA
jgi:hypothetical protein